MPGLGACGADGGGPPGGWGDGASGSSGTASGSGGSGSSASSGSGTSTGGPQASGGTSGSSGNNGAGHADAGSSATRDASDSGPPCTQKGGALTGCAATVPTSIFAKSCAAATCHNPAVNPNQAAAYGLDLTSPGVALRLYNVTASENLPTSNYKLIDPQTPETSYILLKVKMNMPPVGTQMPSMGTKLSAQQQQCLHDWVVAEAANCGRL